MKAYSVIAASMAAMSFALPASAQIGGKSNDTFKAQLLYSACNPPPGTDKETQDLAAQTCDIYFRGLTDGFFFMKSALDKDKPVCLPKEAPISNSEAKSDFQLFLRDHPEMAQNSAAVVAGLAIVLAHPCS